MKTRLILTASIALLAATGCNRQPVVVLEPAPPAPLPVARTQTLETHVLRKEIDTFEQQPSRVQSARVDKAFAEIDGEIAELVEHVAKKTGGERAEAARKLTDLRTYRDAEHLRFLALEAKAQLQQKRESVEFPPAPLLREDGAEKLGEKIDDAARKVGDGLKDAADAIRDKTR